MFQDKSLSENSEAVRDPFRYRSSGEFEKSAQSFKSFLFNTPWAKSMQIIFIYLICLIFSNLFCWLIETKTLLKCNKWKNNINLPLRFDGWTLDGSFQRIIVFVSLCICSLSFITEQRDDVLIPSEWAWGETNCPDTHQQSAGSERW